MTAGMLLISTSSRRPTETSPGRLAQWRMSGNGGTADLARKTSQFAF
jgi:hypothetical protein